MKSKAFDIYAQQKSSAGEFKEALAKAQILLRGKDVKVEWNGHGYVQYIAGPEANLKTRTLLVFIEELPPNKSNVMHMHNSECVVHILSGEGYTVIEGKKHSWEQGDTLFIPPESYHQWFNTSKGKRARFLGICNAPLLQAIGLFKMEDRPH